MELLKRLEVYASGLSVVSAVLCSVSGAALAMPSTHAAFTIQADIWASLVASDAWASMNPTQAVSWLATVVCEDMHSPPPSEAAALRHALKVHLYYSLASAGFFLNTFTLVSSTMLMRFIAVTPLAQGRSFVIEHSRLCAMPAQLIGTMHMD